MPIIARERALITQDVALNGLPVNSPIVIATALLAAGTPLQRTKVIEVHIEYESTAGQTLFVEFSFDGGLTWNSYSSFVIVPTIGPTVLACRRTLIHHNLQLRLRAINLGTLRIIAFIPMIVAEAKVNP